MSIENYLNRIKELPETLKQFGGLILILLVIFSSFFVLNTMFGGGDELVRKMKLEEERIAEEKKLSELKETTLTQTIDFTTSNFNKLFFN